VCAAKRRLREGDVGRLHGQQIVERAHY
jgi:hypothetical protein